MNIDSLALWIVLTNHGNFDADYSYDYDMWDMCLYLYLKQEVEAESNNEFVISRKRKRFYRALHRSFQRIRNGKIPRCALQNPSQSAFRVLYESNNDQALITATGFDHATFAFILNSLKQFYDTLTPFSESGKIKYKEKMKGGRRRDLDAIGCLGLVLVWTRAKGSYFSLCMIFGITHGTCSVFLRFGRRILCHVSHSLMMYEYSFRQMRTCCKNSVLLLQ